MAITSDEVNYLLYRYLQESGFYHSAFVFSAESAISKTKIKPTSVPTGSLISYLQKGLQYTELETHILPDGQEENRCKVPFSLCKKHECRFSVPANAQSTQMFSNSSTSSSTTSPSIANSMSSPLTSSSNAEPASTPSSSTVKKQTRKRKEKETPKAPLPALTFETLADDTPTDSSSSQPLKDDVLPLKDDPLAPHPSSTIAIPESNVTTFKGHRSEVFICSWNPVFHNLVASGSGDSTVRIWELPENASSPKPPIVLKHAMNIPDALSKDITTIEWSPDGKLLGTGGYDGIARVWGVDGQLIHSLKKHEGPIFSMKWNPRGDLLLSGSVDKSAIVWDAVKGAVKQTYAFHSEPTLDVDWRDNNIFATCSQDRNIYICEVGKLAPLRCFKGHQDEVNAVKWDPTGSVLASCSDDCTAKIWSLANEKCLFDFAEHAKEIYTIAWSTGPKPCRLATASFDNDIKFWDIEQGVCVNTLVGHTDPVYSVAFNPSGDLLASGSFDRQLNIWSVRDGKLVASFQAPGGIFEVGWSSPGSHIAVADSNHTLSVLDVRFLHQKI